MPRNPSEQGQHASQRSTQRSRATCFGHRPCVHTYVRMCMWVRTEVLLVCRAHMHMRADGCSVPCPPNPPTHQAESQLHHEHEVCCEGGGGGWGGAARTRPVGRGGAGTQGRRNNIRSVRGHRPASTSGKPSLPHGASHKPSTWRPGVRRCATRGARGVAAKTAAKKLSAWLQDHTQGGGGRGRVFREAKECPLTREQQEHLRGRDGARRRAGGHGYQAVCARQVGPGRGMAVILHYHYQEP